MFDFTVSVKLDRGQNIYDAKSEEDKVLDGIRESQVIFGVEG